MNVLHSLLNVPNCAGVKICLGESADKIAALYACTEEVANFNLRIKYKEIPQAPNRDRDSINLSFCTPSTEDIPLSVVDRAR